MFLHILVKISASLSYLEGYLFLLAEQFSDQTFSSWIKFSRYGKLSILRRYSKVDPYLIVHAYWLEPNLVASKGVDQQLHFTY